MPQPSSTGRRYAQRGLALLGVAGLAAGRQWRALAFLIITIASLVSALTLKRLAEPVPEHLELQYQPGEVDVYVDNPAISVRLTEVVDDDRRADTSYATLYLAASTPTRIAFGSILVVSDQQVENTTGTTTPVDDQSAPGVGQFTKMSEYFDSATAKAATYVMEVDARELGSMTANSYNPYGVEIGTVDEGSAVTQFDRGTFYARLPALATDEDGDATSARPGILLESTSSGPAYQSIVIDPTVRSNAPQPVTADTESRLPSSYQSFGGRPVDLYYPPELLKTEARLQGESYLLDGYQIESSPSAGTVSGTDFVWQDTGGMAPSASGNESVWQNFRSQNDFYAGIAFAIAAAAAVAFLQEDWRGFSLVNWRRRRRRRPAIRRSKPKSRTTHDHVGK